MWYNKYPVNLLEGLHAFYLAHTQIKDNYRYDASGLHGSIRTHPNITHS